MLIRTLAVAIMSMVYSVTSLAIPVSPSVKDVSGYFSIASQNAFHLFADSVNPNLVWYIPKVATIELHNSRPSLTVSSEQIVSGPFNGFDSVAFSGRFSTLNRNSRFSGLQSEAILRGFSLRPAEAIGANTRVMLAGFLLDNEGKLKVNCSEEVWTTPGGTIVVPVCKAKTQSGEWLPVDFLSDFESTLAQPGNIIQTLPFSGKTLPGWEIIINSILAAGTNWDGLIQLAIEWQLPTHLNGLDARYQVDWLQLANFLRPKVRVSGWRLSLPEVNALIEEVISERAGIKVTYLKDGSESENAFSLSQKARVEASIADRLRKYLFTLVSHPADLSVADKIHFLDAPRDVYLPPREEFEQKWGGETIDRFPVIQQQYEHSLQSNEFCQEPMLQSTCPIPLPPPVRHLPDERQAQYILKANYFWLIDNTTSDFKIYHTDIEQASATTLLNIDCIKGAIDQPLIFVNEPACM